MSKLTPTFLLLGVALLVWSLSVSLSSYLSDDLTREQHGESGELAKRGLTTAVRTPEDFSKLDDAIKKDPKNIDAHLARAVAYVETAYASSDGKKLMEAVKSYKDALDLDSKNPQALLGLASLCLEAGIIDKALEYYPLYLEIKPEDLRARADYSLALARGDKAEQAHVVLDKLLEENPSFFPAQMTKAFVYQIEGRLDESAKQAESAKQYVSDEQTIGRIDGFINSLSKDDGSRKSASKEASRVASSEPPAAESALADGERSSLEGYFRKHEIVGPKITRVLWPAGRKMRLDLDNFPVDKMPPFAKAKFVNSLKERFSEFSPKVDILLYGAESGMELMKIEVGN
jgi:Tfp pilus assembly protein PilF